MLRLVVAVDIPMLGGPGPGPGPGAEQTLTVEADEDAMPAADLDASVVEVSGARTAGRDHLEPVAGGTGPR
jgi:hypothetical protein